MLTRHDVCGLSYLSMERDEGYASTLRHYDRPGNGCQKVAVPRKWANRRRAAGLRKVPGWPQTAPAYLPSLPQPATFSAAVVALWL